MAEFAARANLSTEQAMQNFARAGIQPETFRDFILAGVAWREVVRARFGEDVRASLPQSLITRTLAKTGTEGGTRVLVSEILLAHHRSRNRPGLAPARCRNLGACPGSRPFPPPRDAIPLPRRAIRGGELNWTDLNAAARRACAV